MTNPTQPERQVVILHGWGMHAAVCADLAAGLATRAMSSLIELPGHGRRAFSPALGDLWSWARDGLDAAPERAVWLGWSLGGLVALAAALHAPRRVEALILLASTPRFVLGTDWTPALTAETLEQFRTELGTDPTGTLTRFLALQVQGGDTPLETLRVLRQRLTDGPTPDPAALSLGLSLLRDEDLRGRLADIRCPALWIFGSRDTLVPAAVAERVELMMPGAHTLRIEGAAHAPHLSHPKETLQAIHDFLSGLDDPASENRSPLSQSPNDPASAVWQSPCLNLAVSTSAPDPTPPPSRSSR
jgi:pimeloyl-[acyl-carrier protein] methyl ester esterase